MKPLFKEVPGVPIVVRCIHCLYGLDCAGPGGWSCWVNIPSYDHYEKYGIARPRR